MVPAKDKDTLCIQLHGKKLIRNSVKYTIEPMHEECKYVIIVFHHLQAL